MWKVPHGVKLEQMKRPSLEKPIAALTGNDKKQERGIFKLPEKKVSSPLILSAVGQAGITDETDGRRLYDKLVLLKSGKTDTLAACCFDDDPYASSSEAVFAENRKKVLTGLGYAARACGAKKTAAIVGGSAGFGADGKVHVIRADSSRYPALAPAECELKRCGSYAVIGAQACAAVYDAVKNRKPQSETVVTVAGDGVPDWFNCRVKIGTPISEVLGALRGDYSAVVTGSSVKGKAAKDLSEPVRADTRLLLVLKKAKARSVFPCIGCGRCTAACTQGIVPWAVLKEMESGRADILRLPNVQRCIGCAACNVACPSCIDLCAAVQKAGRLKKSGDIYAGA